MNKICPYCGSHNIENAVECIACGAPLSENKTAELNDSAIHLVTSETSPSSPPTAAETPQSPAAQAPQQPVYPTTSPPGSSSKTSTDKWVGGCVLAVVGTAVIYTILAGLASRSHGDSPLLGGLSMILIAGCSILPLIFWIWTIIDCVQNEPSSGNDKIIWLLVIFFINLFGALLYIIIRRPERKRLYGR